MAELVTPDELNTIGKRLMSSWHDMDIDRLIATIRQQWDQIGGLQRERDEERLSRVSLERRVAELEGRGDDE